MSDTPTDYAVLNAMSVYGGSFATALASALAAADPENFARLKSAFPELWDQYTAAARILRTQGKGPK